MSPEETEALGRMEWAAKRWLIAHASRRDRQRAQADRLIAEALRDFRRAERRRRRQERRA